MQQQSFLVLMFGSRLLQFTDSQKLVHCHHSVAMDMIDLEVGTVVLLLLSDRGVVTLRMVHLSGLEHILLKETRMCFPQVDEVPV